MKLSCFVGSVVLSWATIGLVSQDVGATAVGCAPGALYCVTSQNVSGYVDPTPRSYGVGQDPDFSNDTYSDGTNINDRVNSTRTRSTEFAGICFYRNAGFGNALVYVAASHPGWYNNSSTGISSVRGVSSSCVS